MKIHNSILNTILFLICFTAVSTLNAQEIAMPLWDGAIPNFKQTDEKEVVEQVHGLKFVKYVQVPNIKVFSPSKANTTGEAVVIAPGGGYWGLAYDWEGTDIAKWLNSKGITAIVLKYRLPVSKSNIVPHKSPLLDIQRAIRITRFNADEWNIDSNKIGVMGFSAGGHLAATAGTHFDYGNSKATDLIDRKSCRPDFMILLYPVISFSAEFSHSGSQKALLGENPSDSLMKYYSNELQVTKETPPTILIHSQDDEAVSFGHSILFYNALNNKNIPAELHIYPYGGHGYSLAIGKGRLSTWPDRCIEWLRDLK